MKLCWYDDNRLGLVSDGRVHDVSQALEVLPPPAYPFGPKGDPLIAHLAQVRAAIEAAPPKDEGKPVGSVKFLSPVASPTKIIGTPANYAAHSAEAMAQPEVFTAPRRGGVLEQGLFLKANSSLVGASEGVVRRFPDRRTDHEVELGMIIGKTAANVSEADALDYVSAYAIALDMVVRGAEDRSFRKSVDTYSVLGPWLVTADEIPDPDDLNFELSVNGETRQKSHTSLMIINTRKQIAWASEFYTLHPGDIIMSGTCEGVGPVQPGDVMHCRFEKIGEMDVKVS